MIRRNPDNSLVSFPISSYSSEILNTRAFKAELYICTKTKRIARWLRIYFDFSGNNREDYMADRIIANAAVQELIRRILSDGFVPQFATWKTLTIGNELCSYYVVVPST
jgi:hypothetical protein